MKIKKVVITGANSYVGINLIRLCIKKKIQVVAFCRNENLLRTIFKKSKFLTFYHYELTKKIDYDLKNIDTIFHLANERAKGFKECLKEDNNIIAARNLIKAVTNYKKIRVIYLSSHLAYDKTLSNYGKSKYKCEKFLVKQGSIIIKAGFIFGGKPFGLFKRLKDHLRKMSIIPIIFSTSPLYPIHIDDLNETLISIASNKKYKKKIFTLGQKNFIDFREFFKIFCLKYFNKNVLFIPLPGVIIYFITFVLSYFNEFFFNIKERVAGVKSLSEVNTNNNILELKKKYLINTNNFLKKSK